MKDSNHWIDPEFGSPFPGPQYIYKEDPEVYIKTHHRGEDSFLSRSRQLCDVDGAERTGQAAHCPGNKETEVDEDQEVGLGPCEDEGPAQDYPQTTVDQCNPSTEPVGYQP